MDARVAVALAIALLVAGATPLVTAQSPPSPSIAVDVDAQPHDRGDVHHTRTDPLVRVQVTAQTPISLVEVRVDGATRHAFEPSSERFDQSLVLDLSTGAHRLTVVARADGVAKHESTVVLDDEAPIVNYSAPFETTATDPEEPPTEELTVNRGNVTINGTLTDLSAVDTVRVDNDYDYETLGGAEREGRKQHLVGGPVGNFSQPVALGVGENDLTVRAEDAVGNLRVHEFTITVEDDTTPALTVTDVEWVSPTRLHIEGYTTDNVQVQSVWLESGEDAGEGEDNDTADVTRHPLVFPEPTVPDPDRRNVTVDTTVYHPPDTDYVVLGANDTADNEQTWNYSLSEFLAPNVTVHDEQTGYVADRRVAVGGRVTGGQVRGVSVEALDPETGRIVDIRSTDLGRNGSFATRLDAAPDETRIRVRVRDASGAEHLTNVTVVAASDTPSDPAGTPVEAPVEAPAEAPAESEAPVEASNEVRIPIVGIVVPVPQVGGILAASVTVPLPVVGPLDVPLVAVGVPLVLVVIGVRRL